MTNLEILKRQIFYLCNGKIFDDFGFATTRKGWQIFDRGEIFVDGWYIYRFDITDLATDNTYSVEEWFTIDDEGGILEYKIYGIKKGCDFYKIINGVV